MKKIIGIFIMTLLIGTIFLPAALSINEKVKRENKFFENQTLRLNNSTLFLNNYNDSSKVLIELDFTRDTHWDELLDNHKEKSANDSPYLISYNSYLDLDINITDLNEPIPINRSVIVPIAVEYWTNIPEFFLKLPFRIRNYFLFGSFIGPLQAINLDVLNIPDWANIYIDTSYILIGIPYSGEVNDVSVNLIINITNDAPKEMYCIDIIAECDDIKRLNGADIQLVICFTPE